MKNENIVKEDITVVGRASFIEWEKFKNKTIFITGATGLIGSALIRAVDYINREKGLRINIIVLVRDRNRALERFSKLGLNSKIEIIVGDIETLPKIDGKIDYVVHCASQTASNAFISTPVETIESSVIGTINLLKMAREKCVECFAYLSSIEVYGNFIKGKVLTENDIGAINPLELRNSYPISKVTSEALCRAYASEYKIPTVICRLTQTIGLDTNIGDNRLFAYFKSCVENNNNIILRTKGDAERNYIHVMDAVTAILTLLTKGESGQAYNIANDRLYFSISEIAEIIAKNAGIKLEYCINEDYSVAYPKTAYTKLDTSLLKNLGWTALEY